MPVEWAEAKADRRPMPAGSDRAMAGAGPARRAAGGRARRRPGRRASGRARTRLAALAACAACACLAACGSGHPAQAQAQSAPVWQVRAGVVRGLGTIVTDGRGLTLYIYQPDRQGPSVCFDVCADVWPPLDLPRGVRRPVAGPGVNAKLLGTAPRAGGVLQVTYNRWPLYLYEHDLAPGQATGQAEGMGAWYTMSATGNVDRLPLP
jgi:predicted lipoprotein with Yx(FWY)xxD motif